MSKWNNIPNELLINIIKELKRPCDIYKCISINKQCHSVSLPILYKEILVYFVESCPPRGDFNSITSKYQPGKFIKTLSLFEYEPVTLPTYNDLNYNFNRLAVIMTHCPNVEHFKLRFQKHTNWIHFLNLLPKSGWKLMSLPPYGNDIADYDAGHYLNCAYYLRNSLTEITLKTVFGPNYSYFVEFPKLTTFVIDQNIVRNSVELDKLLSDFPKVVNVSTDLDWRTRDREREEITYFTNSHSTASNLHVLNIDNYAPSSDEELMNDIDYISKPMDNLTIQFRERRSSPWFAFRKSISSTVMDFFFTFMRSIPTYIIEFDVLDAPQFLDMYYSSQQNSIVMHKHVLSITMRALYALELAGPYGITITYENKLESIYILCRMGYRTFAQGLYGVKK